MEDIIILTQSEVKECLSMKEAIDAVKVAFSAFAKGRVQMPSVQHLDVHKHNGEVDIKSGFVEDFGLIGTKIASGFYENVKKGFPPGIAVIVLLDLETSMPLAIMDGTHITAYRTGAAGAVAGKVLACKNSSNGGILGAGPQGRMQLLALQEIFNIQKVKIWDIERGLAEQYGKEISVDVQVVDTPEQVVPDADILVTATPSRKALIGEEVIHDGLHINAIGADGPGKQELDPAIMTRASKIVVDSLAQCRRIGEIQHALQQGLIKESSIHAEIGEILNGDKVGRESDNEITIFDATGLSAQDIAAAKIVYDAAKKKSLGKSISLLG
ncbi:MAG: ornithine cyclodeaminase family protein [Candidatus Thorarchaeota archaeon]|jgi:ornithine cyclodeaminase/alanine dehydrogenase